MMDLRRVCVYSYRITNEQLMLSALVPFQSTELTKSFIAHIAFVRFLVRVNTHVALQTTRFTKSFIAKITFIRPLVRVNTHVSFQITRLTKSFLAHIALVLLRSLSLRSFLNKSRFFFLYLKMIRLEIIILVRILKHNTGGCSSPSFSLSSLSPLTFKTVLAFTARCGCGFFRLMMLLLLLVVLKRNNRSKL